MKAKPDIVGTDPPQRHPAQIDAWRTVAAAGDIGDKREAFQGEALRIGELVDAGEIEKADAVDDLCELNGAHVLFSAGDAEHLIGQAMLGVRALGPKIPKADSRMNGAAHNSAPPTAGAQKGDPRFKLEMLDDIALTDDPVNLVEGLLPMGPALGVAFGPPKSLKSFALMHVGLHIAANLPFCGRAVQPGAVVYVTSEGIAGVRRRLIAMRRALGIEGRGVPFALVSVMPNMGAGPTDREALQVEIAAALTPYNIPVRMIVIDTMRRAMPGKSENEQKDVSILVENCEALARKFGAHVMLAHHSPRSDDQRNSGSNALDGAADVMWSVLREADTVRATVTVVRMKDGEEGDSWSFELSPMDIGADRAGTPIASRYVTITREPERRTERPGAKGELSAAQQRLMDIIVRASDEAAAPNAAGSAAPPGTRALTRTTLATYAKAAGWWPEPDDPDDPKKRKQADAKGRAQLSSRLNEIAGKHAIGLTRDHLWIARL